MAAKAEAKRSRHLIYFLSRTLPNAMGTDPHSPRTVLMLTPSSRLLGARRSLLALAESLDPERWRPVVCGQSHGQLGEALDARQIPMEVVKLGWWRKGKYFLWRPFAIARLASLARTVGADLIHCNEIYPNPYAVRAAGNVMGPPGSPGEGRPIPVVTHVRLGMKPGMIRKYDLIRADRIIIPSKALAQEFSKWEDRGRRVGVIYNGVNLDEYQRKRTAEAARLQLGLPVEGLLLGAIGQLGRRKGGDILLDAVERLAPRHPELYVFFVGEPHRGQENFAEKLKRRAAEPPLAGRVFFHPFTEQILPYYEAADVNILASRKEGFGRTIIESGAIGIPSIGARTGGIEEIIVDGATGYLVPPKNPEALTRAIEEMITHPGQRRAMGDAAFKRTAQYFSATAHQERIMNLYDEVLETKTGSM